MNEPKDQLDAKGHPLLRDAVRVLCACLGRLDNLEDSSQSSPGDLESRQEDAIGKEPAGEGVDRRDQEEPGRPDQEER